MMTEEGKQENTVQEKERRAVLVSVYKGTENREICEEHLEELGLLCETYGLEVLKKIPCSIRKYDASTYVTSGKLDEILAITRDLRADLVVFDDEIAPSQQRNLEKIFTIPVIDRTEVILGVFAHRAHTREAKLQVGLAQLQYQSPRLKRMWTHLSRQQATTGGGAYLKGKGEKQIEIDRRLLKKRIGRLQKEMEEVKAQREIQRSLRDRSHIPVFAIVGYTNAGKSTLLNALTEANIFVEDKLFATLDTTTRKFTLSNNQEVLLIDTVGFIRKLPHLLVAAFRSTLEEAVEADVLLHLIDVSHPMAEEQAEAAFEVLKELDAKDKPIINILNKIDRCGDRSIINRLRIKYPKTVQISALNRIGFEDLIQAMEEELSNQRKTVMLRIPQKEYAVVTEIIHIGQLLAQEYEGNDILLKVALPVAIAGKFRQYLENDE
ncbi:MAG: GTPase HflX [Waddliaceae bacterium]